MLSYFSILIVAFALCAQAAVNLDTHEPVWSTMKGSLQRQSRIDVSSNPSKISWEIDYSSEESMFAASSNGVLIISTPFAIEAGVLSAFSMKTGKQLGNSITSDTSFVSLVIASDKDREVLYVTTMLCEVFTYEITSKGLKKIESKSYDYPRCFDFQLNSDGSAAIISATGVNYGPPYAYYFASQNTKTGKVVEAHFSDPAYFVSADKGFVTSDGMFSLCWKNNTGYGLAKFDISTGENVWFTDITANSAYMTFPAVSPKEDRMFYQTASCDDDDGSCTPTLVAKDTTTGATVWEDGLELANRGGNSEMGDGVIITNLGSYDYEYLVVIYSYSYVYAYTPEGDRLWGVNGSDIGCITFDNQIVLLDGKVLSETGEILSDDPFGIDYIVRGVIADQNNNVFYFEVFEDVIGAKHLTTVGDADISTKSNSSPASSSSNTVTLIPGLVLLLFLVIVNIL